MDDTRNFGRCAEAGCGRIYWDSPTHMSKHGMKCPSCFGNRTKFPGHLSIAERFYLFRMYFWETWHVNQLGVTPDSDPKWFWNPMNIIRVAWIGLHPILDKEKPVGT